MICNSNACSTQRFLDTKNGVPEEWLSSSDSSMLLLECSAAGLLCYSVAPRCTLKIELVFDRFCAGSCAGFVCITSWRSGNSNRADQRTAGFDDQPSADDDHARQVANAGLHHPRLTDSEKIAGAVAKRSCGPGFA